MPSSDVRSSDTSTQNARGKNFQKFTCPNFRVSYFAVLIFAFWSWAAKVADLVKIFRYTVHSGGYRTWNSLPSELRTLKFSVAFRAKLKTNMRMIITPFFLFLIFWRYLCGLFCVLAQGRRSRSGRSGGLRTNIRRTNPRKNAVCASAGCSIFPLKVATLEGTSDDSCHPQDFC